MEWNIGCSGFSYKEWKGIFYPEKLPASQWFQYYASQFNSLELNMTFYRFPTVKILAGWYQKSPANFSFAVKVPREITHYKQLVDTQKLVADFYTTCREGLQEKLGPLLFQFPPKFSYTHQRLQLLINTMDNRFTNVVEFRHSSWWNEEVYTQLRQNQLVFCGISHPTLPADIIVTAPRLYYRFHGVPDLYYSWYNHQQLNTFVAELLSKPEIVKANIYFNNTAAVGGVENAGFLQQQLK